MLLLHRRGGLPYLCVQAGVQGDHSRDVPSHANLTDNALTVMWFRSGRAIVGVKWFSSIGRPLWTPPVHFPETPLFCHDLCEGCWRCVLISGAMHRAARFVVVGIYWASCTAVYCGW